MATKPTVHLNGTSGEDLVRGYLDAAAAVRKAVEALQGSAPNARDYYVQGPDAYPSARREHEGRMHRLADVITELCDLAEHVQDQLDARKR